MSDHGEDKLIRGLSGHNIPGALPFNRTIEHPERVGISAHAISSFFVIIKDSSRKGPSVARSVRLLRRFLLVAHGIVVERKRSQPRSQRT